MNRQEIIRLLDKYLNGTASAAEQALLFEYYQKEQTTNDWPEQKLGNSQQTGSRIWRRLAADINKELPASSIPLYRRRWLQAAAVLAVVFAGAAFWYNSNPQLPQPQPPVTASAAPLKIHQAVLTLNDGTAILLDSAADGVLAMQGNTVVSKKGHKLIYEPASGGKSKNDITEMHNRIATAKGAQYQVLLPDGSNAWLNAASAVRFCAGNAQAVRRVEVEGEVYFEVAKNKHRPFRVAVLAPSAPYNKAIIEVLGTHFNINTYTDEKVLRTTLLEGSLKVRTSEKDTAGKLLVPGQQAQMFSAANVTTMPVKVARVVAWQKGLFDFEGATAREVMRQLSRWYDVEIDYENNSNGKRFSGKLSRAMALSDVLKILEQSGLSFKVQGKKITVLS